MRHSPGGALIAAPEAEMNVSGAQQLETAALAREANGHYAAYLPERVRTEAEKKFTEAHAARSPSPLSRGPRRAK